MKLTNSQIETFLKKPYADISLIIVFGPDDGLCQERLSSLIKNLEIDINSGKRGDRNSHLNELFQALCNCESSLMVNNNASAVFAISSEF